MINKAKNYCEIHHYYHEGVLCPFCLSDKSAALSKKFCKVEKVDVVKKEDKQKENQDITEEDIAKLMNKFNKR